MKRLTILVAATLWLTGCTWTVDMRSDEEGAEGSARDPFFVEAELFYHERVALPGDAEVLVAVDAVGPEGRATLTRFSTGLEGRQVPIPLRFSVEPENGGTGIYELSAAIVSGHRLLRLTGPVLVMPRDKTARVGRVRLRPPLETGFGQAWQCASTSIQFGAIGERAFLAVDERLHAVEPVAADSGLRYRSRSDSQIGIREKDGGIVLIHGEDTESDCQRIEALEPPLSGGGNEPGWRVEIGGQRIELISDYGQTVTEARLIQTGSSGRSTRFRGLGEHGPVLADFRRMVCRDSATGMPHPYTIEMQFEGGTLDGCGGRPRQLLLDTDWRITRIGDERVPGHDENEKPLKVTMQFDEDGRVGGSTACNRYTAEYKLGGEGLSIGAATATKMACAGTRMALENRFLNSLAKVQRFDIGPEGQLILIGPGGRITAQPGAPGG